MTDSANKVDDRRQSFRIDMEKEFVDIHWDNVEGAQTQKKLACLDFSRGGLRIESDQEISIHTKVTVRFKAADPNSQLLQTNVIRCQQTDDGWYDIALKITD